MTSFIEKLAKNAFFNVSIVYNLILHNNDSRRWYNKIDEHIFLGAMPLVEYNHHHALANDEQVSAVLTLNEDFELEPHYVGTPVSQTDWTQKNVDFLKVPTKDLNALSTPDIIRATSFIDHYVKQNKNVYIHCKAGRGRSVLALVCYFIRFKGMTAESAINKIKEKRSHIRMSHSQIKTASDFEQSIKARKERRFTN